MLRHVLEGTLVHAGAMARHARVLVVDDEPMVREVLTRYLRRDGFEVDDGGGRRRGARRPSRPVARTSSARPDAAADRRARGLPPHPGAQRRRPVIMLTARGEETDRVVGLELGADDYVDEAVLPPRGRGPGAGRAAPASAPERRASPRCCSPATSRSTATAGRSRSGEPVKLTRRSSTCCTAGRPARGHVHPYAAPRRGVGLRLGRRHVDRDGPHPAAPREDRGGPVRAAPPRHRLGRRLPVRAMNGPGRTVALVVAVAAAGRDRHAPRRRRRWGSRPGATPTSLVLLVLRRIVTIVAAGLARFGRSAAPSMRAGSSPSPCWRPWSRSPTSAC